jgi:hypothetical protein
MPFFKGFRMLLGLLGQDRAIAVVKAHFADECNLLSVERWEEF